MVDLVIVLIAIWAFRDALGYANGQRRESRAARIAERAKELKPHGMTPTQRRSTAVRHDLGWWLREIGAGFPVTLYGLHAGWIAHKAAAQQAKDIRDGHKSRLGRIRELGKQNVQTLVTGGQLPTGKAQPTGQPGAQQPAPVSAPNHEPPAAGAPTPVAGVPPAADPEPRPSPPQLPPVLVTDPPPLPTRSNGVRPMPTETDFTYDRTTRVAGDLAVAAEQMQADLAKFEIGPMIDQLSTSAVGLDRATLGELADMGDTYETVATGMQRLTEQAQQVRGNLASRHGAVNEAHQDAPEGGAEKAFYQEG